MADKDQKTNNSKFRSPQELLGIIWGVVEGYSRRTLILIVCGNLLLAGAVIGGIWYYLDHRHQPTVQLDPESFYTKNIDRLEDEKPPAEPMERATYYSQLGSNYETSKVPKKALEYYLKAQQVVEEYKLGDSLSFNQSIGDMYALQKDNKRAREYYNREITRLESYKQKHPEEAPSVDELIKSLRAKAGK